MTAIEDPGDFDKRYKFESIAGASSKNERIEYCELDTDDRPKDTAGSNNESQDSTGTLVEQD